MSNKEERKAPVLRFKGFTDDWEQRKLGDISERINRKNEKLESNLPLTISAQYGLVDQKNFFNKQVASKNLKNYILLKKGEFAYNKSYSKDLPYGAIKRLNLYSQGVISSLYIAFKPVNVNSNFLEQYFNSNKWYKEIYRNAAEGARNHGLLNIAPKDFFSSSLNIPSDKTEQKDISNLLFKLDKLLSLQQRKLEQLELLQKSILQTIFTSNNKKEKIELNKLANYRRGSFPQPYTNKKWYGGKNSKPFVQVIDVNDNLKLHEQTKERISEIAQPKSVFVPKGSIIVTLQGSIGRVAITQYDSYVDRTLLILTDFKKKIDKYYFANALKMVFNKEKLKAPGGTIKTITKSTLSSFKIVLPNIKLQIQYGKLLKSVDKQIILNKNRIMKLKKIKQFLLQNIFI